MTDPAGPGGTRPRAADRRALDGLAAALLGGDMAAVLSHLAPDVVLVSDGGPTRRAARRPVRGPERVARFLTNLARRAADDLAARPVVVNGLPGLVVSRSGRADQVVSFELDRERVRVIRIVGNPDKLRFAVVGAPPLT